MYTCRLRSQITSLAPYSPGLSIDEIRQKYGRTTVIKMASNENPLGVPPLAQEAIKRHANEAFRYPRSGNPRLRKALADLHHVPENNIVVGNGSDEIIDLLIRLVADPAEHNIVCAQPCFALYPIQAQIAGVQLRRAPLNEDFSFDFAKLLALTDEKTRLVFLTTPDNPSGYLPPRQAVADFATELAKRAPDSLLVIDEAYMDFAPEEKESSLLASQTLPDCVAILRTFSKSYGLAGLRLGYAILPEALADAFMRARLPFSVNCLAEEAGLAALADTAFREATLTTIRTERPRLTEALRGLGCTVWPSAANYLLFRLPTGTAEACAEKLLQCGIIIRRLTSYDLPNHLRVSIGTEKENSAFLKALATYLSSVDKGS